MTDRSRFFQVARQHVLKDMLEPAGFVQGKSIYVREYNGQVHGLEFQVNRYGGGYFVNVAFHYSMLPGFFECRLIQPKDFSLLDFLLWIRLERLCPAASQKPEFGAGEWKFSDSLERTVEVLTQNTRSALEQLETLATQWGNPEYFLDKIPPGLILRELGVGALVEAAIGNGWRVEPFALSFFLAKVAAAKNQMHMAQAYIDIACQTADFEKDLRIARELAQTIK